MPLEVSEFAMVGFAEVFQHTPLAVTGAPPSLETFPPETAVVNVIDDAAVVVTNGGTMVKLVISTLSIPTSFASKLAILILLMTPLFKVTVMVLQAVAPELTIFAALHVVPLSVEV